MAPRRREGFLYRRRRAKRCLKSNPGSPVISFLMTSSALRLTPRVRPVSNPLLILLGNFKGFRVLLRPWNPPRKRSRHQPFALLIIPLVCPKSCQTSPSHGVFFFFTRDTLLFGLHVTPFLYRHHRRFFRKAASNPFLAP